MAVRRRAAQHKNERSSAAAPFSRACQIAAEVLKDDVPLARRMRASISCALAVSRRARSRVVSLKSNVPTISDSELIGGRGKERKEGGKEGGREGTREGTREGRRQGSRQGRREGRGRDWGMSGHLTHRRSPALYTTRPLSPALNTARPLSPVLSRSLTTHLKLLKRTEPDLGCSLLAPEEEDADEAAELASDIPRAACPSPARRGR